MNPIDIFTSLGDENRLRIMQLLMHKSLCVCELETLLNLTQTNVSRHLSKLKKAGLLTTDKDAQWVHYRVNPEMEVAGLPLLNYLKTAFIQIPSCTKDLDVFLSYETQELTCKDIKQDMEQVKLKIGGNK